MDNVIIWILLRRPILWIALDIMAMSEHVDQVFSVCMFMCMSIDVKHLLSNKKTNFISAYCSYMMSSTLQD